MPVFDRIDFGQMREREEAYRRLGLCIGRVVIGGEKYRRVLDLGCGLGFVIDELRCRHDALVMGVDDPGVLMATGVQANVVGGDISRPIDWAWLFDVVICTETAEHLEAEHADTLVGNVVSAMASHGVLVWSAAPPGQEWPGHVNLQPPEYWLVKFEAKGLRVLSDETIDLRAATRRVQAQHHYAAESFYVMRRS